MARPGIGAGIPAGVGCVVREEWRRRLGDRVVRHPRQRELQTIHVRPERRRHRVLPTSASSLLLLIGGFAILIGVGTLLLLLPIASAQDGNAPLLVALFTATSATCVTGLVVVESATYWTGFGQGVIAALMYLGGLGILTAGTVLLIAIGRRINLPERLVLRESLGVTTLGGVIGLVRQVFILATAIQVVGFLILFFRFLATYNAGRAAWQALFHSISAFNNAGFFIFPDSASLSAFQTDYLVLLIMGVLIVLGALSFVVIADLARHRRFSRWTLDTRLVVLGTAFLWLVGGIVTFFFEFRNGETLGELSLGGQVANSLFQSVGSRTAGFSTVDFGATQPHTNLQYVLQMFVGGAAASTAGGIKINTAMVLAVAVVASLRGRSRAEAFKRELPYALVARAMAVVALAMAILFTVVMSLTLTEQAKIGEGAFTFLDLVFEAVSAFATTGLSTGITGELTHPGQYILAAAMYVGRLGPLTIALGLALRERRAIYRFAQETVRIG